MNDNQRKSPLTAEPPQFPTLRLRLGTAIGNVPFDMKRACCWILPALFAFTTHAEPPFELRFVDADTGRGIPLVEAWTVNDIPYVSDSHGRIAFDEPGLLGRRVFFNLRSHGYEMPKDGLGMVGVRVRTEAGGRAEFKLKRVNIAERLYRITGQGIYADSLRLGHEAPLANPLLNGEVVGQDSTQAAVYRGRIRWFWGDTSRASYPLGHFQTAGAVSQLPAAGGLEPSVGVDLTYHTNKEGFSRPMAPMKEGGLVWIDGLSTLPDAQDAPTMLSHFSRRKSLAVQHEHGILRYDDDKEAFVRAKTLDLKDSWRHPRGQATSHNGYVYFAHPFATTRVKARAEQALDPNAYEALTLTTNKTGGLVYAWQRNGTPIAQKTEAARIKNSPREQPSPLLQLRDAGSGKPVLAHAGSIRWNAHRQRWILIVTEHYGSSFLGEVWYAEAPEIIGPWGPAVKIATHEKYSFYNPVHHAFFDQKGGRFIYFEGTYTKMFSGNKVATPRYDYNQIMYRLDLDDPRLAPTRMNAENER